jgi:hypothetical protein
MNYPFVGYAELSNNWDNGDKVNNKQYMITAKVSEDKIGKLAIPMWIDGYSNERDFYAGLGSIVDKDGMFDISLLGYSMDDGKASLAFRFISVASGREEANTRIDPNDPTICRITIKQ